MRPGVLFLVLAVALSGCGPLDRLRQEWDAMLTVLQGGRSPFARRKLARPAAPTGPLAAPGSRANAELLREVYAVVFGSEPRDPRFFAAYLNGLDQGASLEGIYNGFTRSAAYRGLESSRKGASPEALRLFVEEIAELRRDQPRPTVFKPRDALPLARLGEITEDAPLEKEAGGTVEELFRDASIFTLKRVLGDELLKVIDEKKRSRRDLSVWYSQYVARAGRRNVDFGLPLRNQGDDAFHSAWALTAADDRILWEVLNRAHRMLNEADRKKWNH